MSNHINNFDNLSHNNEKTIWEAHEYAMKINEVKNKVERNTSLVLNDPINEFNRHSEEELNEVFSKIDEEFLKVLINEHWKEKIFYDLAELYELAKVSWANSFSFFYLQIPAIENFVTKNPEKWNDLVELGKIAWENIWDLFYKTIPAIESFINENPEKWDNLVELGKIVWENVCNFFQLIFPYIEKFTIKNPERWNDLLGLGKKAWKNSYNFFYFWIFFIEKIVKDNPQMWPQIWYDLIELINTTGVSYRSIFENGLLFIKNPLKLFNSNIDNKIDILADFFDKSKDELKNSFLLELIFSSKISENNKKEFINKITYSDNVYDKIKKLYYEQSPEEASKYFDNIKKSCKWLVSWENIKKIRKKEEYDWMVKHAFPKWNYWEYKENMKNWNKQKHLNKYIFEKNWYKTKMTWFAWFNFEWSDLLKDLKIEDFKKEYSILKNKESLTQEEQEKLSIFEKYNSSRNTFTEYQDRFKSIRWKINNFWKFNSKEAKDNFEKYINDLLQEYNTDSNLKLQNIEEKILQLFLYEISSKTTNNNIQDSLVLYKYIYEIDLEQYIQNTANQIDSEKMLEQNHALWINLIDIYDDQRKDTIKILLDKVNNSWELTKYISETFNTQEKNIPQKKLDKIKSQLENDKIPVEKRYKAFEISVYKIFAREIPDEEKDDFKVDIEKILISLKEPIENWNIDLKNFEEIYLPKIQTLYNEYVNRFNIEIKKQFWKDSTKIRTEINKFKEVVTKEFIEEDLRKLNFSYDKENRELKIENYKEKNIENKIKLNQKNYLKEKDFILEKWETWVSIKFLENTEIPEKIETLALKTKEKKKDEKNIIWYFTKTKETSNARTSSHICLWTDTKFMWNNSDYFEYIMLDEDTWKTVWVTMLLNIEAKDWKKYLWFGPNPYPSFLSQVSSKACYKYMKDIIINFANENGYDGVVVPSKKEQIYWHCTNRSWEFPELIKKSVISKDWNWKVVQFWKTHKLWKYWESEYWYADGALIWEK